ncbi:PEP-CTERM sorting domain-containing protein [Agarivorans sp. MS3-6]
MKFLQKVALLSMFISSMLFSLQSTASVIVIDPLEEVIVTSDIFDWVWASPCSGGCSQLVDNWEYAGGLYDDVLNAALGVSIWRFASIEEFANIPASNLFSDTGKCGAQYFDNRHDHCDFSNPIERVPNGGFQETLLVRFNNLPLAAQVSEPASFAMMFLALFGLVLRRRS